MPYDENLATRVRALLDREPGRTEKKMFGGLVLLLDGSIAVGVYGAGLLVRTDPAERERRLAEPGVREFAFGGRPMKGFVFIEPAYCATAAQLRRWVARGVATARGRS
jgi:TfoX/Sxy family transcriptional regulator of competence genes